MITCNKNYFSMTTNSRQRHQQTHEIAIQYCWVKVIMQDTPTNIVKPRHCHPVPFKIVLDTSVSAYNKFLCLDN